MTTEDVLGYVIVGFAEGDKVARITDGYARLDRAELDCDHFNRLSDGLVYEVACVMRWRRG